MNHHRHVRSQSKVGQVSMKRTQRIRRRHQVWFPGDGIRLQFLRGTNAAINDKVFVLNVRNREANQALPGQLQILSRSELPPDTSHSPGSFADAARVSLSGRRLTEERMST
jgi:hypothetical protein